MAQQPKDECCNQLVAALTAINTSLGSIFTQLSALPSPAPPPDFTPLVNELTCLCTAAQNYPAFVRDMVVYLGAQMAAIAKTIVPPIDFTPIVDELKIANTRTDIPENVLAVLREKLNLPPELNGLLQGLSSDWYDAIIAALNWWNPSGPLDKWVAGDSSLKSAAADKAINWIRQTLAELMNALGPLFASIGPDLLKALQVGTGGFLKAEDAVFEPIVKTLVDQIAALLKPVSGGATSLGNIGVSLDQPVAVATGTAFTSALLGWIASYAGIDAGEPLAHIAELVAGAVGFEQLTDVVIGPLVQHGIKAVAEMQARSLFRQHLPGGGEVTQWMARGLITASEGKRLLNFDGYGDEIQPPTVIAAQRGLNPRMLLQLIVTGLFTTDDLGDEMTFSGLRPASQQRLKLASPYLATVKFRDAARASIEAAYVAGLLSDSDLTEQLDSIEHNTDRDNLILVGSKWKKLTAITKDLEAQYATLFEAGLLDDATFHDHLTAIGLQDDVANAVAAKSEARANATLQRRTIADARALAKATAAQERRAATRSYVAGQIDLPALAIALTATGLTPIQAAAWSEIAQLQKTGTPRWIYGLRVPSEEATLLRSRVSALLDQRKRQLLTDPQFHDALASLGIPPEWINSLRATADAMITPKAAAVLTPIVTNNS